MRYLLFGSSVAEVGDMQVARRLAHGPLPATVVAGGRRGVRVARELLHRREVAYGVKEVPDERLAEVVGETSFILASLWRLLTIL